VPAAGGGGGGGGGGAGGSGGWFKGWSVGSIDLGDGIVVLIAFAVLILVVAVAGGYVVWAAPEILSDALFQAVLAGPLARRARRLESQGWVRSVLRATGIPFVVVLLVAGGAGWVVQYHCPAAVSMATAIRHCVLN
jgi:hypothetical protein